MSLSNRALQFFFIQLNLNCVLQKKMFITSNYFTLVRLKCFDTNLQLYSNFVSVL